MARLFATNDTTMPIPDTHMEMANNQATHHVIGGCGVTLDGADLTLDIAAGAIVSNGAPVTVAAQANALTLVADSSNPRWSWIALNSSGTAVLVSGTAAASPAIPELNATDDIPLMLVYVAAGATVASAQTNYDQRVMAMTQTWRSTANFTKNNNDTLGDVTLIKFFMDASQVWKFTIKGPATIGATPDIKVAFTVPTAATIAGVAKKIEAAAITAAYDTDLTSAQALASAAAGIGIEVDGIAINSTTAGWVQFQAAQNTATGEDTIIHSGTWITADRVA